MMDFLGHVSSITPEIVRFLRGYQCGVQERSVKVCCPDNPIPLNVLGGNNGGTPTPVITTIPRPPDVSNHRNLQLLPRASDCGILNSRNRIVNGNKTALFEFPWMTLLSYRTRNGPDFRCGGTLISDRYVLTAAHCITHLDNLTLLGVRLGEYNISSATDCIEEGKGIFVCADPVQDIFIEEVIPHPNYNYTTYSNDIGLLRLSLPAQFKESVQPICLPIEEKLRNKNHLNTSLLVTGWGSTGSRSRRSEDLLKVNIPVIPEAECKAAYNQTSAVINYRQMCAGGKNRRDSCGGDSGGPLQFIESLDLDDNEIHFVQYGIVSFGPRSCGQEGLPGVYTRIDYYMDWILDNIRV